MIDALYSRATLGQPALAERFAFALGQESAQNAPQEEAAMPAELSDRYAPILHLAKGERFFPMAVEDLLSYAALYRRDEDQPLAAPGRVRAAHLLQVMGEDTYLRTLTAAPLTGADVVRGWNADTRQLLVAWARSTALSTTPAAITGYDEGRAQRLYRWYSVKTQAATRLFWWNDLLMARTFSLRRRGAAADPLRLSLPAAARDEAMQRYEAAARSGSGYTYYYRLVRQGGYAVLQYWYLYAYQDWATAYDGLSDHEGDWESVQLFFRLEGEQPVEPPAYIAYLGHGSRLVKPWLHRDVGLSGTTRMSMSLRVRTRITPSARSMSWSASTAWSTVRRAMASPSSPMTGAAVATWTRHPL
ncbi:MAG: hypothetical protein ABFD20_02775 [Anaerolineales bacterium]